MKSAMLLPTMTTSTPDSEYLQLAKTLWVEGEWEALVTLADNVEENAKNIELNAYLSAAFAQLGNREKAEEYWQRVMHSEVAEKSEKLWCYRLLISGVHNILARARDVNDEIKQSHEHLQSAASLVFSGPEQRLVVRVRKHTQLKHVYSNIYRKQDKGVKENLFIDCGGYDGCSVIKFLLKNPGYDVVSFEANPELWEYYKKLPTKLVKKAVYDHDGIIEFTLDPIDADGSSLIKEKVIDFNQKVKNEDCPKLQVECIDLSKEIENYAKTYKNIVLKLDVEGAEYAILEKMLADETLKYISHLYAEFHWNKIGMKKEEHDILIEAVSRHVKVDNWDAQEFGVHKRDNSAFKRRSAILAIFES